MKFAKRNKKAVIWVSTVIYTLIGLSVIALLLAVVRPKIAEMKDSFVIRQTISALNELDDAITEIRLATGNTRRYDLYLSRGELRIYGWNDTVEWYLSDSHYMFSEPGVPYQTGNIIVATEKSDDRFSVTLTLDYSYLDITFSGENGEKLLSPAKTPYVLFLENKGPKSPGGKPQIDITLA